MYILNIFIVETKILIGTRTYSVKSDRQTTSCQNQGRWILCRDRQTTSCQHQGKYIDRQICKYIYRLSHVKIKVNIQIDRYVKIYRLSQVKIKVDRQIKNKQLDRQIDRQIDYLMSKSSWIDRQIERYTTSCQNQGTQVEDGQITNNY